MSDVVDFPGITMLSIPPEKILEGAKKQNLADVLVIGWTGKGELYFASSSADGAEVNWLIDQAKAALIAEG